jgi:oligogalacturonide lyase
MSKGCVEAGAGTTAVDPRTGVSVRQVTDGPAIHHHPFFLAPAYDDAMRRLFFVSHETGTAQVCAERQEDGAVVQLTDRDDLDEWSLYPAHGGDAVYFTAVGAAWRLDLETLEEQPLFRFPHWERRRTGGVAGDMGTTALSRDDRWWAVHFKQNGHKSMAVIDTRAATGEVILDATAIGHIQFCPDDPELIAYAGEHTARIRMVRRNGGDNRLVYEQRPGEWITHETWLPGRRELAFVDWPHGIRAIDVDDGRLRDLAHFNAWHAAVNRQGTQMVADTNFPDIGLQLFQLGPGSSRPTPLCYPEASNAGDHWGGPFPYGNGPISVYAPQHTHPHPSFSPDGRQVVFTSDRTGNAQVYVATIPDPWRSN